MADGKYRVKIIFSYSFASCAKNKEWRTVNTDENNYIFYDINAVNGYCDGIKAYSRVVFVKSTEYPHTYKFTSVGVVIDDAVGNQKPVIEGILIEMNGRVCYYSFNNAEVVYDRLEGYHEIVGYYCVFERESGIDYLDFFTDEIKVTIHYKHKSPDAELNTFEYVFPISRCKI